MRDIAKRVIFVTVILFSILFSRGANGEHGNGTVCSSIDVRNFGHNLHKLMGCEKIEGSLQIVLLEKTNAKTFRNYSFPLVEVSQYVLIYRVSGLRSLGRLFPNLTIIRGTKLYSNAALAVFQNPNLEEINLPKLTHILAGSVFIHENPSEYFAVLSLNRTNLNVRQVFGACSVLRRKEERRRD